MRTPWGTFGGDSGGADTSLSGGFGGGDYPPGDITPGLGGFLPGPGLGGTPTDPNQQGPGIVIPPWLIGLGGGSVALPPGRAGSLPPLTGVPPPPDVSGLPPASKPPAGSLPPLTGQGPKTGGFNLGGLLRGIGKGLGGGQGGSGGGGGGRSGGTPAQQGRSTGQQQQQYGMTNPLPYAQLALPRWPSSNVQQVQQAMPLVGSYQQGGIVPETGLYPVSGGEQVVPAKQVKGLAKLHKGELVLPRSLQQQQYLGQYQEGGIVPQPQQGLPPGPLPFSKGRRRRTPSAEMAREMRGPEFGPSKNQQAPQPFSLDQWAQTNVPRGGNVAIGMAKAVPHLMQGALPQGETIGARQGWKDWEKNPEWFKSIGMALQRAQTPSNPDQWRGYDAVRHNPLTGFAGDRPLAFLGSFQQGTGDGTIAQPQQDQTGIINQLARALGWDPQRGGPGTHQQQTAPKPIIYDPGMSSPQVRNQPGAVSQNQIGMDPALTGIVRAARSGTMQPRQAAAGGGTPAQPGVPANLPPTPPGMQPGAAQAGMNVDMAGIMRTLGINPGGAFGGAGGQYGQITTGIPGWQGSGPPMRAGAAGGPTEYIQAAQPAPFPATGEMSAARGAKQGWEAQNITSRIFGGLLAYEQRKYDKQVEEASQYGFDKALGEQQAAQQAAQPAAAQAGQQAPGGAATATGGAASTFGRQAASLGAPGTGAGAGALQGAQAQIGQAQATQQQQAAAQQQGAGGALQAAQQQAPPGLNAQQAQIYNTLKSDPDPKVQKQADQYLKAMQAKEKRGAKILAEAQMHPFGPYARGLNMGIQRAQQQQYLQYEIAAQQQKAELDAAKAKQAMLLPALMVYKQQAADTTKMQMNDKVMALGQQKLQVMERIARDRTAVQAMNATQRMLQAQYKGMVGQLTTLAANDARLRQEAIAAHAAYNKINVMERWWGSDAATQAKNEYERLDNAVSESMQRLQQAYSQMQSLDQQWKASLEPGQDPGAAFNVDLSDINSMSNQINQPQFPDPIDQAIANSIQVQQ